MFFKANYSINSNKTNSTESLNNVQSLSTSNLINSKSVQSMGSNPNVNKLTTIGIPNSIATPCKLCGNAVSAMRCTECLGMHFCFACDNMYHRHPKRKHHVRKSINLLNTTANYLINNDSANYDLFRHSSFHSINNLPNQHIAFQSNEKKNVPFKNFRGLEQPSIPPFGNSLITDLNPLTISSSSSIMVAAAAHPSNMPIPPPRRKKNNSNDVSSYMTVKGKKQFVDKNFDNFYGYNDNQAKIIMTNNYNSSCGNLSQFNIHPKSQNGSNPNLHNDNRFIRYTNKQNNFDLNNRRIQQDWENKTKQSNYYLTSSQPSSPFSQIKNKPNQQIINPYLQRRNLSLTDINKNFLQNNLSSIINYPNSYETHSLSQSMEEFMIDDEDLESYTGDDDDLDNYSSNSSRKNKNFSNRRTKQRNSSQNYFYNDNQSNKKKLMRRSQSSSQLKPMILQNKIINPQQKLNYYFDIEQQNQLLANYCIQQQNPLLNSTSISPASSLRSLEPLNRKNSVNSVSSRRSSSKKSYKNDDESSKRYPSNRANYRSEERQHRSSKQVRSKSLCRSKSQSSTKSYRSVRSARIDSTDSDERNSENYSGSEKSKSYSDCSNDDEYKKKKSANYRLRDNDKVVWKCKYCTYVNNYKMKICEMCSKSNPQFINKADSDKFKLIKKNKDTNFKNKCLDSNYIEFSDELVKQQEEVEKEILRRLANEKLVEEENMKLETKQKITNENVENSNRKKNFDYKNFDNKNIEKNDICRSEKSELNQIEGRHREDKQNFEEKQSSFRTYSNVQQFAKHIDKRISIDQKKFQEQKSSNIDINNQLIVNDNENKFKNQVLDGMEMFKILKEAEKKGYWAEEVEIALTFNQEKPITWLDENWSSMTETVLTLANNQLLTSCQELKMTSLVTVNEEDSVKALRLAKGNIWQAVDKCVNSKKNEVILDKQNNNFDTNFKTFKFNQMENLLKDWYEKNLIVQMKDKNSENELNNKIIKNQTSEKVKSLIAFLKTNGYFDTKIQTQKEIDEQMIFLMKLLEKKLKETTDYNSLELNVNSQVVDKNLKKNDTVQNCLSKESLNELEKIDKEFEAIDEKMRKNLSFLEKIEKENEENSKEVILKNNFITIKVEDVLNEKNLNEEDNFNLNDSKLNLNRKKQNLKITGNVSVDDDQIEFLDATDELDNDFSIHNIKLPNIQSNSDSKKEKGKIKIIKRKIYKNSSSEQKSFEKVVYVNNMNEVDLINFDEDFDDEQQVSFKVDLKKNSEAVSDKTDESLVELETNEKSFINDSEYDEAKVNIRIGSQLLIDDDIEKQLNKLNPNFGYARTIYECELCTSKYHISELISMLFCTHRACKFCLEKYFTIQIREKQRIIIKCPFCDQPEIPSDDEDSVYNYLTLLEEMIKNIVSKDVYELFQQKIRDRTLQKDPLFKWCSKCGSGFLANNIHTQQYRCPDCKAISCSECGELWQEEHQLLTCEQFKQFLLNGDKWMSEHKLSLHLNEFGIRCPKCFFHYELSKGGCMHFHCVQCEHDFCSGCNAAFKLGDKCPLSKGCEKLGFHAHHPRNCLFYLRDKKPDDLEKLLKTKNIDFTIKDFDSNKKECDIIEQKEINNSFIDEPCKRNVTKFGLCNLHYIEHLGKLIKMNHIDPVEIFNEEELLSVFKRELIEIPLKSEPKNYKTKLIETIKIKSPIV